MDKPKSLRSKIELRFGEIVTIVFFGVLLFRVLEYSINLFNKYNITVVDIVVIIVILFVAYFLISIPIDFIRLKAKELELKEWELRLKEREAEKNEKD